MQCELRITTEYLEKYNENRETICSNECEITHRELTASVSHVMVIY